MKNPVTPPAIDTGTVQLVAQRLNHYTTPGPIIIIVIIIKAIKFRFFSLTRVSCTIFTVTLGYGN